MARSAPGSGSRRARAPEREYKSVVGKLPAIGERYGLCCPVDRRDPRFQHAGRLLRPHKIWLGRSARLSAVASPFSHAFDKRRPLIGRDRLLADEGDRALPTELAQHGRGGSSGMTGPGDHDMSAVLVHPSAPVFVAPDRSSGRLQSASETDILVFDCGAENVEDYRVIIGEQRNKIFLMD